MNFLLAILLYLGSISPNSTYQLAEINYCLAQQQSQISAIQQDPMLNQQVQNTYGEQASVIIVVDPDQQH